MVSVRFAFNIFRPELRHLPCLQLKACIHRYEQTLLYFYIHRLPSSRLLCRLHILEALAASFLLRSNDGVVLLNSKNIICSTLNGLMLARKVPIQNESEEKLRSAWQLLRPRGKGGQRVARSCGAKSLAAKSRTHLPRRFALDSY